MKVLKEGFDRYLEDESNSKSTGIELVYLPRDKREIAQTVKGLRGPFTVYGGGTGITGAATAEKGVIISTESLKGMRLKGNVIHAGCGVTLKEIHGFLDKYGLWYPVDSTEQEATIGGNIATNAWGTRSYKYGSVRDFVEALEIILPCGDEFSVKRGEIVSGAGRFNFTAGGKKYSFDTADVLPSPGLKSSAGYYMMKEMDIIDLFIGSEGTLGIITGACLRTIKKPDSIEAYLACFPDEKRAFSFVKRLKTAQKALALLSMEYFDGRSVAFLKEKFPAIPGNGPVVIIEKELYGNVGQDEFLEFLEKETSGIPVFTENTLNKTGFVYAVRESLPRMVNEKIRQKGIKKVSTDFAVPEEKFDGMAGLYGKMLAKTKIEYVMFGHIGNNNLHINFLPSGPEEYKEAKDICREMAEGICGMGGTVSAEHGIGKLKKEYFKIMYSDMQIEKMIRIKKVFDPEGICCPGNIF